MDVEEVNKINALFREQKRMFDAYFASSSDASGADASADASEGESKALENVSNEHDSTYLEVSTVVLKGGDFFNRPFSSFVFGVLVLLSCSTRCILSLIRMFDVLLPRDIRCFFLS